MKSFLKYTIILCMIIFFYFQIEIKSNNSFENNIKMYFEYYEEPNWPNSIDEYYSGMNYFDSTLKKYIDLPGVDHYGISFYAHFWINTNGEPKEIKIYRIDYNPNKLFYPDLELYNKMWNESELSLKEAITNWKLNKRYTEKLSNFQIVYHFNNFINLRNPYSNGIFLNYSQFGK